MLHMANRDWLRLFTFGLPIDLLHIRLTLNFIFILFLHFVFSYNRFQQPVGLCCSKNTMQNKKNVNERSYFCILLFY